MLTKKTTRHDGSSVEKYHLSAGPDQLPIEIQALAWLATTRCCCCKRSIEKYVTEYPDSYIETIETNYQTGKFICKQYFHFR